MMPSSRSILRRALVQPSMRHSVPAICTTTSTTTTTPHSPAIITTTPQTRHFHLSQILLKKKKRGGGGGAASGGGRAASFEQSDADFGEEDSSPASSYFDGVELNQKAVSETMQKHVKSLQTRLQSVSIRPQPSLLEELNVSGEVTVDQKKKRLTGKIKQYGNVIVKNPRLMSVNVFDPAHTSAIDRAIRDSDLGFNPEVKGNLLDVPIPKVTNDVKEKYQRTIKEYAEEAKRRVRSVRQNIMKTINKDKKSGDKDAAFRSEKSLQNVHDKFIKEIENVLQKKSQEISRG